MGGQYPNSSKLIRKVSNLEAGLDEFPDQFYQIWQLTPESESFREAVLLSALLFQSSAFLQMTFFLPICMFTLEACEITEISEFS